MNRARIVVLTIAVGAGGVAACLESGSDSKPPPAEPVAQLQTWPAAAASNTYFRLSERPDATTQIAGLIASSPDIVRYRVSNPTTMQK